MDENGIFLIEAADQRKENEWTTQEVRCDSSLGLSQAVVINGSNLIVPFEKTALNYFL